MQEQTPPREAELADFILMVWVERRLVVAVALGVALVVTGGAWILPDSYRASSQIMSESEAHKLSDYRPIIDSESFLQPILVSEGVTAQPYGITAEKFRAEHLDLELQVDGRVLGIAVEMTDPVMAAKLANRIADSVVDLLTKVASARASETRDQLREQVATTRKERDRLEEQYLAFQQTNQPEALAKDIDALLTLRSRRRELFIAMERERARLAAAQQELGARPAVQSYRRTLVDEPTMGETVRLAAPGSPLPLTLQFADEVANPVVQSLDVLVATSRTNLAGFEKEWQEVNERLAIGSDSLPLLQKSYHANREGVRLTSELTLLRNVYSDLYQRLAQAEVDAEVKAVVMRRVVEATAPLRPQQRPRLLILLVSLGAGLALGSVAAFLRQYLTQYRASVQNV